MSRLGSFILDTVLGSLAERLIIALAEKITSASELTAEHGEGGREKEFYRASRKNKPQTPSSVPLEGLFSSAISQGTQCEDEAGISARGCSAELPPLRVWRRSDALSSIMP